MGDSVTDEVVSGLECVLCGVCAVVRDCADRGDHGGVDHSAVVEEDTCYLLDKLLGFE